MKKILNLDQWAPGGEDLIMDLVMQDKNFHIQSNVKIKKRLICESYEQAKQNSKSYEPIVVMKRNNSKYFSLS